jgi:hypothetical protein
MCNVAHEFWARVQVVTWWNHIFRTVNRNWTQNDDFVSVPLLKVLSWNPYTPFWLHLVSLFCLNVVGQIMFWAFYTLTFTWSWKFIWSYWNRLSYWRRYMSQGITEIWYSYLSQPNKNMNYRRDSGSAIAQAVSRWPLTAKDRVRARVTSCGICSGRNSSRIGFSPSSSVFSCQYIIPPLLHLRSVIALTMQHIIMPSVIC